MATHTFHGAELIGSLGSILEGAIPVILHHHDHYSRESKKEGRHGHEIPIGARVVAVADTYDAIVTDRSYRRGRSPSEAIAVIREGSGKQFAPEVVSAFERIIANYINKEDTDRVQEAKELRTLHRLQPDIGHNIEIPPPSPELQEQPAAE